MRAMTHDKYTWTATSKCYFASSANGKRRGPQAGAEV